jgi:cell division septum initiation protein DivIVA
MSETGLATENKAQAEKLQLKRALGKVAELKEEVGALEYKIDELETEIEGYGNMEDTYNRALAAVQQFLDAKTKAEKQNAIWEMEDLTKARI